MAIISIYQHDFMDNAKINTQERRAKMFELLHQSERGERIAKTASMLAGRYLDDPATHQIIGECMASLKAPKIVVLGKQRRRLAKIVSLFFGRSAN
jgi:hypothetical protein